MCEMTKWTSYPSPGGLFDQAAWLVDLFMIIWEAKSEHDRKEAEAHKAELGKAQRSSGRRPSASRRR